MPYEISSFEHEPRATPRIVPAIIIFGSSAGLQCVLHRVYVCLCRIGCYVFGFLAQRPRRVFACFGIGRCWEVERDVWGVEVLDLWILIMCWVILIMWWVYSIFEYVEKLSFESLFMLILPLSYIAFWTSIVRFRSICTIVIFLKKRALKSILIKILSIFYIT